MSSTHVLGITSYDVSFSGVVINLNNNESNNIYFSSNISTFLTNDLVLGSLFCAIYKHKCLKYGLIKYPACISFTLTGTCVPFRTFSLYNF